MLLRTYCNVWIKRGFFHSATIVGRKITVDVFNHSWFGKFPSKISLVISLHDYIPKRRPAVDVNLNQCISINTHESRFSKSTEQIKSKNISFERLFKAQSS